MEYKNIARIKELEAILDESRAIADDFLNALDRYKKNQDNIKKLEAYYESKDYLEDVDADNLGLIPKDLKRGILSEDSIYDLLRDNDYINDILKNKSNGK